MRARQRGRGTCILQVDDISIEEKKRSPPETDLQRRTTMFVYVLPRSRSASGWRRWWTVAHPHDGGQLPAAVPQSGCGRPGLPAPAAARYSAPSPLLRRAISNEQIKRVSTKQALSAASGSLYRRHGQSSMETALPAVRPLYSPHQTASSAVGVVQRGAGVRRTLQRACGFESTRA